MRRITIVAVGKLKDGYYRLAADEYEKRLGRFCRYACVEVAEERSDGSDSPADAVKALRREGDRITAVITKLAKSPQDICIILADVSGRSLSSEEYAALVKDATDGGKDIAIIIGGSLGVSPEVRASADFLLSMSKMTFPRQLARLAILEQTYRAFKIIAGETYHK